MIDCKNKLSCGKQFAIDKSIIYDVQQVIVNKKTDYLIEVQCPYCKCIFAIPIVNFFSIRHKDDFKRISKIYLTGYTGSEDYDKI